MKKRVGVVFGGCSSEYDVSLMSATSVIENIDINQYTIYLIGISKQGDCYLFTGDTKQIQEDTWLQSSQKITFSTNKSDHGFINLQTKEVTYLDVVFPVLHGQNGEDGRLQGLLELAGIPYVGCDMTSSAICMDKYLSHRLVSEIGIQCAKSHLFTTHDSYETIVSTIQDLSFPLFVKPLKAGSSFGITKIQSINSLKQAIKEAFSYDSQILIEENIDGFEVGCAILGNQDLVIGEVDQIVLEDGFFDYFEKYNLKTSQIVLPAYLSQQERQRIQQTAMQIYRTLGCSGFARVDMFYTSDHTIVFNEVNTIPGCTSHSRYPNMLKAVGMSFSEVINRLIQLGLER